MAMERPETKSKVSILDLPESIFTEIIFPYFEFQHVYFKLRSICRRIKEYVDSYVELGGIYFNPNFDKTSRTYFVFKRQQKVVFVYCKWSKPYSNHFPFWFSKTNFSAFGLNIDNKVVVGTLCERYVRLNKDIIPESKFGVYPT